MQFKEIIKSALKEDIGTGDITTSTFIPSSKTFTAVIKAKEKLVLCGLDIAVQTFRMLDSKCKIKIFNKDGNTLKPGDKILQIKANRNILSAERTALNFLQRLSGIATLTKSFADKVKGAKAKIFDTRKTTPGLRELEKYAVAVGDGNNHRFGLYDGVMIKDNHIKTSSWELLASKIKKIKQNPKIKFTLIEVKTFNELKKAVNAGPDIILLDNMNMALLKKSIKHIKTFPVKRKPKIEISGGVNLKNIRKLALLGPDRISIGQLTHSARAMDISMDITS
jgi:nicotinate-nucleotide pyrophosphorylase (carboxylating)